MRPAPRKKAVVKAKPKAKLKKAPKQTKIVVNVELDDVRAWVQSALSEVRLARDFMSRSYAGPEHEALQLAEHALEMALALRPVLQ